MAIEKRTGKRGTVYHFRVLINTDSDGKQHFKRMVYKPVNTAPSKIEKEVQQAHAQFVRSVTSGTVFDEKLTFKEFFETWLQEYGSKQLTPAEYEANEKNVKRIFIPEIGHLPINQIKGIHLQKIINKLEKDGLKPKTIQKYFSEISTVFTRAYKLDLIENNPCKRVTLPRNEKDGEIHAFTVSQAQTFLSACENGITVHHEAKTRKNNRIIPAYDEHLEYQFQFLVYFTLAIYSGFRRGEMIGLKWENVDFNNGLITINHATSKAKSENGQFEKDPKTKAGNRTISLPEDCFILLKQLKTEQKRTARELGDAWQGSTEPEKRYIFTQADGKQMDLYTPSHKFKEILTAYNSTVSDDKKLPEIHLHDLRHTSASILISAGVDIATVSRRLGHSDITTTLNTYTHALPDIDHTASSALKDAFSMHKNDPVLPANEGHSRVIISQTDTNSHKQSQTVKYS